MESYDSKIISISKNIYVFRWRKNRKIKIKNS